MTFEDWQAWLESQFVDDDEPSTGAVAPPAPEPASNKSPAILRLRDDLPPPPPGVTYATEPSPYVQEIVVPQAREQAPPPVTNYASPPAPEPPAPSASAADEDDVPSIEQYLPFLRQTAEPIEHAMVQPIQHESPKADHREPPPSVEVEAQAVEPSQPFAVDTEDVIGTEATSEVETHREVDSPAPTVVETIIADIETIEVGYSLDAEKSVDEPDQVTEPTPGVPKPEPRVDAADMIAIAEESIRNEARDAERRSAAAQRHRSGPALEVSSPISSDKLWGLTPRSNPIVIAQTEQVGTAGADFRRATEARLNLISRLLDPNLPLAETARLLNVEPVAVQRKPAPTVLVNMRPAGESKRYKLSDVISFLEQQSRNMANDTRRTGASP